MGYGLKVLNNNNEIQIDSNYHNICEVESATSETLSNDGTPSGYYDEISITNTSDVPLIVFRPNTNYYTSIMGYKKIGSDYSSFGAVTERNQSSNIDWKLYRVTSSSSADNYGMRVYNDSGDLVFDGGKDYLKIHSVSNISIGTSASDTQDVTHNGISDPYYVIAPPSQAIQILGAGSSHLELYFVVGLLKLSSTSVRVGWFTQYIINAPRAIPDEWVPYNGDFKLLVCDV